MGELDYSSVIQALENVCAQVKTATAEGSALAGQNALRYALVVRAAPQA
jgi:hypothetical protein